MSRARRILRWLAIGLGGVLGLVALTLGALSGLAQTEGGRAWLKGFLELPNGIPSHDTLGRVFAALNAEQFQTCFVNWNLIAFPIMMSTT